MLAVRLVLAIAAAWLPYIAAAALAVVLGLAAIDRADRTRRNRAWTRRWWFR